MALQRAERSPNVADIVDASKMAGQEVVVTSNGPLDALGNLVSGTVEAWTQHRPLREDMSVSCHDLNQRRNKTLTVKPIEANNTNQQCQPTSHANQHIVQGAHVCDIILL